MLEQQLEHAKGRAQFFFSSRRRHTRSKRDWSSDVCSSDLRCESRCRRLAASTSLPTTSAPSPGEFADVYRRLAQDHDGCISIHIGAQLSATAEAARVGASSVDGFTVNVVDSETVSMPIAFLCRIAAEPSSLAEATAAVEQRVPRCRVLALLD